MNRQLVRVSTKVLVVVFGLLVANSWSQQITRLQKGQMLDMLQQISPDIKKHYYDPKFQGVDWDAKVAETTAKINAADSVQRAMGAVASR